MPTTTDTDENLVSRRVRKKRGDRWVVIVLPPLIAGSVWVGGAKRHARL